jgi:tRNA 2-thiouridine synthesizing protein A
VQQAVVLDAGEIGCGELTLLMFQTMKRLAPGQLLEVYAYDLAAAVDIPAWCRSTGHLLVEARTDHQPKRFLIRKKIPTGVPTHGEAVD